MMYAVLFRTLILRFVVYFGCVAVFVPLFRGDILDRSLHYYSSPPEAPDAHRREILSGFSPRWCCSTA
jgi:hypothetical protein